MIQSVPDHVVESLVEDKAALLACLKAFVEPWSKGGPHWQSLITYDTYNNARIAIAKAEGRNP